MIGVVPVIKRRVVLADKNVMIAFDIILEHNAFDADRKLGFGKRIKLKNRFAKKGNAVVQLRGDKQILLAQAKRNLAFFILCKRIYKAADLCILSIHFSGGT